MDLAPRTILDLARQRARDIASSPRFTREARTQALAIERELTEQLRDADRPTIRRVPAFGYAIGDQIGATA